MLTACRGRSVENGHRISPALYSLSAFLSHMPAFVLMHLSSPLLVNCGCEGLPGTRQDTGREFLSEVACCAANQFFDI